ncbi:MAG: hypothetical protein QM500_21280 [Methylococcales bacterium]
MGTNEDTPAWQKLVEEDRTLEGREHVARYETGEANDDDYIELAYDSYVNGQFKQTADYLKNIDEISSRTHAVIEIKNRIANDLHPEDSSFSDRFESTMEDHGVYETTGQKSSMTP